MNAKPLKVVDFGELLAEHRRLEETLSRLARIFRQRSISPEEVAGECHDLREQLVVHFQEEEEGGFFEQFTEVAPELTPVAESLQRQHCDLLMKLNVLYDVATVDKKDSSWWDQLDIHFDAFVRTFHEHEHQENRLMQEAFTQDTGDKD